MSSLIPSKVPFSATSKACLRRDEHFLFDVHAYNLADEEKNIVPVAETSSTLPIEKNPITAATGKVGHCLLRDGNLVRFRKVLNKSKCQGNRSVLIIETIKLIVI